MHITLNCTLLIALVRFIRSRNPSDAWLVAFTVPWCGHCHRLGPVWERVASRLQNTPIRVGKVDAQAHRTLASYYQVHGYPTIKLYDIPYLSIAFPPRLFSESHKYQYLEQHEGRRAVQSSRRAQWGRHHRVRQTRLRARTTSPHVAQAVRRVRFAAFERRLLPLRLCAGSALRTPRHEHKAGFWDACLRSWAPGICTLHFSIGCWLVWKGSCHY